MTSFLNALARSPQAIRRLFSPSQAPVEPERPLPATIVAGNVPEESYLPDTTPPTSPRHADRQNDQPSSGLQDEVRALREAMNSLPALLQQQQEALAAQLAAHAAQVDEKLAARSAPLPDLRSAPLSDLRSAPLSDHRSAPLSDRRSASAPHPAQEIGDSPLISAASQMESPVDSLLMLIILAEHNPELYSTSSKRWTTNCHTLFQHLKTTCPDMCLKLELGTQKCGKSALKAILEFESGARSAMHPDLREFTLVGLDLIGISKSSTAAAICENLVCLAIRLADSESTDALENAIAECERTGLHDRGLCERDGITQEPGFLLFDPATAAGQQHWILLGRLIKARFSASVSLHKELAEAKSAWLALRQEGFDTGQKYRNLAQVGGFYSDQTKIEYMKAQCSPDLLTAFEAFTKMQTCLGVMDPRLETDYGEFTTALERVGKSLDIGTTENALTENALGEAIARCPTKLKADPEVETVDPCWNWTHVGECSYGAKCKYEHPGDAGAKKHTVTTKQGNCMLYSMGKCNRNVCPFPHEDDKILKPHATIFHALRRAF